MHHSTGMLKIWWDANNLVIPDVQRDLVWTSAQSRLLIDSILRNFPIPKFYFGMKVHQNGVPYREVFDGQQRLTAIFQFMDDQWALGKDHDPFDFGGSPVDLNGKKFSELHPAMQSHLHNYSLDCVEMTGYSDAELEDLFLRLQRGEPLNAAEKRRAIPGTMRDVVAALADHALFSTPDFVEFANRRYAHQDAVAKVLHQFIHDTHVSIAPARVERTYRDNRSIGITSAAPTELKACMKWLLDNCPAPPLLKKHTFITWLFLIRQLRRDYALIPVKSDVANALLEFERLRALNRTLPVSQQDQRMLLYTDYARSDSPANMQGRAEILLDFIFETVPRLSAKATQRFFTHDQRRYMWYRDKQECQMCREAVSFSSFHADHIIPHSLGGPTSVDNGQVLCASCNTSRGNSI